METASAESSITLFRHGCLPAGQIPDWALFCSAAMAPGAVSSYMALSWDDTIKEELLQEELLLNSMSMNRVRTIASGGNQEPLFPQRQPLTQSPASPCHPQLTMKSWVSSLPLSLAWRKWVLMLFLPSAVSKQYVLRLPCLSIVLTLNASSVIGEELLVQGAIIHLCGACCVVRNRK